MRSPWSATFEIKTSWMDSAPTSTPASPMPQDPDWAGGTIYENTQTVDDAVTSR